MAAVAQTIDWNNYKDVASPEQLKRMDEGIGKIVKPHQRACIASIILLVLSLITAIVALNLGFKKSFTPKVMIAIYCASGGGFIGILLGAYSAYRYHYFAKPFWKALDADQNNGSTTRLYNLLNGDDYDTPAEANEVAFRSDRASLKAHQDMNEYRAKGLKKDP